MRTFPKVVMIAAALTAIAAAQQDAESKADIATMQGEWSMVSGSADGFPFPAEMLPNAKRVCKGNETTVTSGPQLIMQATFTVDATKKPKTIDYKATDGRTKGKTHLGIYEFDGDTIKYCFASPDGERPTEFTSKQGERRTLSVWKKARPAE